MKITSWNINGLRSIIDNKEDAWFHDSEFDVICLQEVKMQEDMLTSMMYDPKSSYWNTAIKLGYSGVTTIVNPELPALKVIKGIGDTELDNEGRVITTEFDSFIIVNTYAPHSHRELKRLNVKEAFIKNFNKFIKDLKQLKKPLIIVGDLNVAHQEIDLFHHKNNKKNAGFLPQERQWMTDLLSMGFVDAFRFTHPEEKQYSWWGQMYDLRNRDIGWRIDYALVDNQLKNKIIDCYHLKDQLGSDHCPVILEIDI